MVAGVVTRQGEGPFSWSRGWRLAREKVRYWHHIMKLKLILKNILNSFLYNIYIYRYMLY